MKKVVLLVLLALIGFVVWRSYKGIKQFEESLKETHVDD